MYVCMFVCTFGEDLLRRKGTGSGRERAGEGRGVGTRSWERGGEEGRSRRERVVEGRGVKMRGLRGVQTRNDEDRGV